jgi:hypothetical protein
MTRTIPDNASYTEFYSTAARPGDDKKVQRVKCRHCHAELKRNITGQRRHLEGCEAYGEVLDATQASSASVTATTSDPDQPPPAKRARVDDARVPPAVNYKDHNDPDDSRTVEERLAGESQSWDDVNLKLANIVAQGHVPLSVATHGEAWLLYMQKLNHNHKYPSPKELALLVKFLLDEKRKQRPRSTTPDRETWMRMHIDDIVHREEGKGIR